MADLPRRDNAPAVSVDGLTHGERKFVEAFCSGMSMRQAWKHAGLAPNPDEAKLQRLSRRPHVAAAIKERQEALRRKHELQREDIVKGLLEAIKDAKLLGDPGNQISGWKELAKMFGYYEPERKIITIAPEVEIAQQQLASLTTEDLLRLAGPDVIEAEFTLIVDDDGNTDNLQDRQNH